MKDPEFSETQFVFGYLRELYEKRKSRYTTLPFGLRFKFPTTVEEKEMPVDFYIENYSHSEFYQFKRSEGLMRRRGKVEINAGLAIDFLPYYRFKIYNDSSITGIGQFEKLIQLTTKSAKDWVFYCAPCFHLMEEFFTHYYDEKVVNNSVLIDCRQLNDSKFKPPKFNINDNKEHYFTFRIDRNYGFLCSDAMRIEIIRELVSVDAAPQEKTPNFIDYVNRLFHDEFLEEKILYETLQFRFRGRRLGLIEQIHILQTYLLNTYDIVWIPIINNG